MVTPDHLNAMPGVDNDAAVLTELSNTIETLQNGVRGYATAADEADDSTLSSLMSELAASRQAVLDDVVRVVAGKGGDIPEDLPGTIPGAIHRGWMQVKAAIAGDDAIVSAALTGEAEATSTLENALDGPVDPEVEAVLRRALLDVEYAKERLQRIESS